MAARDFIHGLRAMGFTGPTCMLIGFFDETASPNTEPKVTGVAGCLFDDAGIEKFRQGWADIGAEFKREFGLDVGYFHATHCCGDRTGHRHYHKWESPQRQRLGRDVATLVGRTRRAAFVSTCDQADYDAIATSNPAIAAHIGGSYPATVMTCLERVGWFAKQRGEKVEYVFEKGDLHQATADSILNKVRDNPHLRDRYAYALHTILPKCDDDYSIPLIAADILAWECRSDFSEILKAERNGTDAGNWTPNFLLMRGDDETYFEQHLGQGGLEARALINAVHGLN